MSSLTEIRRHRNQSFDNNGNKTATYYNRYKGGYGFIVEWYTKEERRQISHTPMKGWLVEIIHRLQFTTGSSPENALRTLKMYFDACMALSTCTKKNPIDQIERLRLNILVRHTYEALNSLTPVNRNEFELHRNKFQ